MLTALTMSPQPHERPRGLPRNVAYLNVVGTYTNPEDYYQARREAVRAVQTEGFFFQDIDDPLPNKYPHPAGGIVYGDFHLQIAETGAHIQQLRASWTEGAHKLDPFSYIRRGICDTRKAQEIAIRIPARYPLFADFLLYYFLAKAYGAQYHPDLEMVWRKRPDGMHTLCQTELRASRTFLAEATPDGSQSWEEHYMSIFPH